MKLAELVKRIREISTTAQARQSKIDSLKNQRAEIEEKMLALADQGKVEEYKELNRAKIDIDAEIFVYSRQMQNVQAAQTEQEVCKAWGEFAADYNKRAESKYKEFEKQAAALCTAYQTMVKAQCDAMDAMREAGSLLDDPSKLASLYKLPIKEKSPAPNYGVNFPEIRFFVRKGIISSEVAAAMVRSLRGE